ncbi:hypothetical protein M9H77_03941 [Catharanthus roseus]|uniref:Uncharacterized protein n=1 Tax=Catharanthus roseus TaxID=4058 RepID=A0ACC0CD28_CATRO|nr:hypothetical protein M9H77_03941 [Catharanthus roseus]
MVDPLERWGVVGFGPIGITSDIISCFAMGQPPCGESGGIESKMPELVSDDLVMGSGLCPLSSAVALHVLLNSGVEVAQMCLDSFRLPSYIRTPHIGSSISDVKATKEKCFIITLHELFT